MLRIPSFLAAVLVASSVGSVSLAPPAHSAATAIPATPFAGRVTIVVEGPSGGTDGLILDDHTLLEFPAVTLAGANAIRVGDQVRGTGIQVLSAPNRVFDQIALYKAGQLIFDDSKAQYAAAPILPSPSMNGKMKSMTESAPLIAVGSTPDGQIDRIILSNGANTSYVQIPQGAYVNPRSVILGQPIAVSGAGMQFPGGDLFIHAFTAETVGGPWLLQARGYDGEKWMLKEGPIKQALVTPEGNVDGVLLTDNTAIFFTPVPGGQVTGLLPGTLVRAAGSGVGNRMSADSLLLTRQDEYMPLAPVVRGRGLLSQMAGQVPPPRLIPMKDRARVEAIFRTDRGAPGGAGSSGGAIDTIVLADRTRVWVPPRLRPFLPHGLAPGKTVVVSGRGGTYMMGVSIEANQLKQLPTLRTG